MTKIAVVVLLGSVSFLAMAATFDPPDLSLEYQLHRQYLISHGEQSQSQQGLLENYQLQQGESLWGLSQMLYGDGNYWPKVWAQNQSITNPHLIRPGYTLQFLMGSEDDTPAFRFSESEDTGLELAAASSTGNPQIQVPPPETPPRAVIGVPQSFPEWQRVYRTRVDRTKIDDSKISLTRAALGARTMLTAFVQDSPLMSVGSFLEMEKEAGLPASNEFLYVKIKKGVGQIGQRYLIVHDFGKIHKLNSQVVGPINARFIQIYGDVELKQRAHANFRKSADADNFEVFRALLHTAVNLTITQFDLIPGQLEYVEMTKTGPTGPSPGQIIGSAHHEASAVYGPGDIVFFNKGRMDGYAEGQVMDLYIDRTIRDERTPITYSSVPSGMVKIVKVSGSCSTGVILSSIDSVQQGDRIQPMFSQIGGSELQSDSNVAPSAPSDQNMNQDSDQPVEPMNGEELAPNPEKSDM